MIHLAFVLALLAPQEELESSLADLFRSLSGEQREACLKSYNDKNLDAEVFLPGKRPGLLIGKLSDEQYKLLGKSVRQFLSRKGYDQAMKVARQSHRRSGLRSYYLNFFGDPTKAGKWAFRVSEHHLTLVHVNSDANRFGPILLGANPATLWKEQEDAAMDCFDKLSGEEKEKCVLKGPARSGRSLGKKGIRIGDLSEKAQKAAGAMVEARLKLFNATQRKKLRKIIKAAGGTKKLRLAFFGAMTKRCIDGGRTDWKIEGMGFLCDFESSRGHIHMTLRGRARKTY